MLRPPVISAPTPSEEMTAFVPEAAGHNITGHAFQKFAFDLQEQHKKALKAAKQPMPPNTLSCITNPHINILPGGRNALITYVRLMQNVAAAPVPPPPPPPGHPPREGLFGGMLAPPPPRPSQPGAVPMWSSCTEALDESRLWQRNEDTGNWMCVHYHKSRAHVAYH